MFPDTRLGQTATITTEQQQFTEPFILARAARLSQEQTSSGYAVQVKVNTKES